MGRTFKGGVHPDDHKVSTCKLPIMDLEPPEELVFPMTQHIGAPASPCVKVGEQVFMGQKIGAANGFMSACIHSSVSGTVKAIEKRMHPNGLLVESVVIANDGKDTLDPAVKPVQKRIDQLSTKEIIGIVQEAGMVGMGGATFPTHVKLSPPDGTVIDYVIVNGAECEPYLTSDHRAMLETTEDIIGGIKILAYLFGLKTGYIGIETNKPDAIEKMKQAAATEKDISVNVIPLKTKYPQGGEKQLINVVTGRKVGPGQLPYQVGAMVVNIDTCASIYRAVKFGLPLMRRIVTVGGDCVNSPANFRVRIGTSFRYIFEQAGGFIKEPVKVIMGGPMMGLAVPNLDLPVIKGTSGLLAFGIEAARGVEEHPCVKCAKCVYVCPMRLLPNRLDAAARRDQFEELESLNITDCIECGSCAFVCPSKRRQVQQIKVAKVKLRNRQVKAK